MAQWSVPVNHCHIYKFASISSWARSKMCELIYFVVPGEDCWRVFHKSQVSLHMSKRFVSPISGGSPIYMDWETFSEWVENREPKFVSKLGEHLATTPLALCCHYQVVYTFRYSTSKGITTDSSGDNLSPSWYPLMSSIWMCKPPDSGRPQHGVSGVVVTNFMSCKMAS